MFLLKTQQESYRYGKVQLSKEVLKPNTLHTRYADSPEKNVLILSSSLSQNWKNSSSKRV